MASMAILSPTGVVLLPAEGADLGAPHRKYNLKEDYIQYPMLAPRPPTHHHHQTLCVMPAVL